MPQTVLAPSFASAIRLSTTEAGDVNSKITSAPDTRCAVMPEPDGFSLDESRHTMSCPRFAAVASISPPILPVPMMPKRMKGSLDYRALSFPRSFPVIPLLSCHPFALPPCHPFALPPCHPERSEGSALFRSSGTFLLRAGSERSEGSALTG